MADVPSASVHVDLLQAAQSLAHLGSFHWDLASNQVTWSDELYRLYDLPADTPLSRETYMQHIHPQHRQQVEEAVARCVTAREPYDHDYRIVRRSGEVRWVHGRGRPIVDKQGSVVAVYGTCHDVTDRKDAEQALIMARASLEQGKAAERHVTELRNIIDSLVQVSQALDQGDERAARRALQETLKQASRIILDLTRSSAK